MAEVLITLGIIGIVAAMTLPSLIGKWQKKVTVTRLKRTYTVLAQAVQRSIADYGDPLNWDLGDFYNSEYTQANVKDMLEKFTSTYMVPYLAKVKKIEYGTLEDLGYKSVKIPNDESNRYLNTKGQVLVLNDGTVLQIRSATGNSGTDEDRDDRIVSIYIITDINGFKGPNVIGKDFFTFQISLTTGEFGFFYQSSQNTREKMLSSCKSSPWTCGRLILMDGWEIKEDYPWW